MRKLFLKFSVLLFVLGMSINPAWAGGSFNPSQLPPEMIQTLMSPTYCAQLTGLASSTGGGKVYVNAPVIGQSASADPREGEYEEGKSNVAVSGMGMSMAGMTKIGINAWAKADDGYWLAGFSYSNMGTDLGTTTDDSQPGLYANTYDIGIQENETIEHVIYATFEPIRIAKYEISESNTTSSRVCSQTVTFTVVGTQIDANDFKAPYVTSVAGGGSWTSADGDAWTTSDLTIDGTSVSVVVKFTAPDDDVADYSANFVLETQAIPSIKMSVPLNARTIDTAENRAEAIRYNKNKEKIGEGSLADMIAAADPTDVIKLNKNIDHQVVANKSFTLDLNGYNIEHHYNTTRTGEFDNAAIAEAALLVQAGATITIAYSPYGGEIIAGPWNDAADVFGKLILNGGTLSGFFGIGSVGEVIQNGATINGSQYSSCAIASQGKVTITDGKMNAMVGSMGNGSELIINGGIIDNTVIASPMPGTPGHGVQIGGGICRINKGTIIGRTYGVQNVGGTITTEKLAVITGGAYAVDFYSGKTTINCGKFDDPTTLCDLSSIESKIASGNAVFVSCYLKTNNPGSSNYWGIPVWRNTSGAEFREGYEFFVGPDEAAKSAGVSVCHIGGTSYSSLEDALDYANNTSEPVVIIMDNDYTLPAGYYTIPSNATLLVPMSNEQGAATAIVNFERSYTTPSLFRKLTLASGVNMDVFGTIEISGKQYSGDSNQSEGNHTGAVIGDYAQLQMNEGSKITMQNNSILRAWGYVTGDIAHKSAKHEIPMGEIDVRRGATVYELFQMGDWGNTVMNGVGLVSGDSRFPITSYFIQNIEVPTKYHPGGRLTGSTTVSANGAGMQLTMCANNIQIIGVTGVDVAMFLMNQEADAENTWVRKWYDASKDQQVYEINSAAHIGNLVINLASSPLFEGLENTLVAMGGPMGTIGNIAQAMGAEFHQDLIMSSGQYVLPITSNFKLHLLSGTLDFTQSTELVPGSELEIDKEATVYVTDQDIEGVREGSLYIYDWRDWDDSAAEGQPAHKILYAPAFDDGVNNGQVPDDVRSVATKEDLGHAQINVHGTFDTRDGYVFTSGGDEFDPEHGGNIFSSVEDAGTFKFTSPALRNEAGTDSIEEVKLKINGGEMVKFYPAYLKNQNGTYVHTGGTAAGQSYCYIDMGNGGEWTMLEQRGCFTYNAANGGTYYIKPQEYVAVAVSRATQSGDDWTIDGNSDHTFSDAAGAGRLFILLTDAYGNCHWWEVEKKDNLYHCIHPSNDTYYYWTGSEWAEKTFQITWKDWDGTVLTATDENGDPIDHYEVTYGTMADWGTTNPQRAADGDYTYNFSGWTPALGKVTGDVTYTATYERKAIKYTIIFEDGVEIERHLLARNEQPVCENVPTRTGYILQWNPALAAVTGNQTYTATWLPEPPSEFEIRFVDYDGTTELQKGNVAVGEMPEYEGDTPTGKATWAESEGNKEFTYVFDHWSPALTEVDQALTYTAVYREVAKEYTITFKNADNSVRETQKYQYGETPVCSNPPTQAATAQYTYSLRWTPQIQTVMDNATYKAVFDATTNKYSVTVKSNPSGACSISGAGIYDYNESSTAVTISLTTNSGYTFTGWSDNQGGTNTTRQMAVTGDINLVANFTVADPDYTITWKNEDGSANLVAPVGQKAGTATTYTGPTPTKAATSANTFEFDGWATKANGPKVYKNGMTPKATANATYYAHFAATPIPSLEVNGAPVVLSESVTYQDLIITSNGTNSSSQLLGSNNLTLTGNAYFDLAINAKDHTWYAISVPWQVDAETGVSVNGRTLKFGREFDILYYDGAKRAEVGKTGEAWKYMETEFTAGNRILQPGRLYMIGLTNDAPVIRFTKKAGAKLLTTSTQVYAYPESTDNDGKDANWNGIANPALFHAYVNAGVTKGQMYDVDSKEFTNIINLDSKKLVLGQAVFVQVLADKSITVTHGGSYAAAPRRAKAAAAEPTEYDVRITPYGAEQYADRLFVQIDEDKDNSKYVIGKDLAKFGVSSKVAQMWINRYDAKLCMNTMALVDETAEFPLGIYVPAEGKYTIGVDWSSLTNQQHALYLTYDGEAIWNLSKGAIMLNLPQGTDTHYGLRLGEKKAPQTATAIDEAIVDAQEAVASKVLIGNQVFIIRGEKVYSIDGQLLK